MTELDELGAQLREHALLEGDFLLRSGKRSSYYLDKYRFETLPELLGPIGERLAAAVRELEPDAVRLAGPGARRRRAGGSGVAGVRAAVRDRPRRSEGVRDGQPARRRLRGGRARVPVEDVVTSGGAARRGRWRRSGRPVSWSATRSAWSIARRAARTRWRGIGVRLRSLFRAAELVSSGKKRRKTAWLSRNPTGC